MKTKKKIIKVIDDIEFGFWDDKDGVFITFGNMKNEEIKKLIKSNNFRKKLLDSIDTLKFSIKDCIGRDLKDIWERLDKLEKRIEEIK